METCPRFLHQIHGNTDLNIDYNIVDQYGRTSLTFASIYGQYNVVKFLLGNVILPQCVKSRLRDS